MILWIASDHAGFALKEELKKTNKLAGQNIEWKDLGPTDETSTDYPLHAQKLTREIKAHKVGAELLEPCGVLICGSGVGVSIAANRVKGIRAVLAASEEVAKLSRQHNASNVLCLGSRLTASDLAKEILKTWLATPFEGGRHEKRVQLIDEGTE